MAIVRWDPFSELDALHSQLNSLFSDNLTAQRGLQLAPVTDVYREGDKNMVVEVHLPDFDEKEVDVAVHDNALEIRAEHQEKDESKKKREYILRESSSSFYRRIPLPKQADEAGVKAHFEKGVLRVTVPFKELPKPKKIAIEAKSKK